MDFSMSEESTMLQNAAARYLKEKCPGQIVKDTLKVAKGYSEQIWRDMADMGWLGWIYPEKHGGSAGSYFDLFLLFQEIGRVRLPSPFYTSAFLSASIIAASGDKRAQVQYLPALINGTQIMSAGILDRQGLYGQYKEEIHAERKSNGTYVLNGTKVMVPYANAADTVLVSAGVKNGVGLFILETKSKGIIQTPLETLTGEKASAVTLTNAVASGEQNIGSAGNGIAILDAVSPKAKILRCAEMLGGLERVFDLTLSYMKERKQFDKPLGSLQIVQHYCVDMYMNLETAKLITYQAAQFLSDGLSCPKEVAMAKAWCNDAYKKATWVAHQLHGGIGFCEEHDLHLYYKHAKALELEWGETYYQNGRIADAMGM